MRRMNPHPFFEGESDEALVFRFSVLLAFSDGLTECCHVRRIDAGRIVIFEASYTFVPLVIAG
jgi:hypothetical protein